MKPSERFLELFNRDRGCHLIDIDSFDNVMIALLDYLDEVFPELENKLATLKIDVSSMYESGGTIFGLRQKIEELEKKIDAVYETQYRQASEEDIQKEEPDKKPNPYAIEPIKPCAATTDGKHEWLPLGDACVAECKHCGNRELWAVIYNKAFSPKTYKFEPIFPEPKEESKPECEHEWKLESFIGENREHTVIRKCTKPSCNKKQIASTKWEDVK